MINEYIRFVATKKNDSHNSGIRYFEVLRLFFFCAQKFLSDGFFHRTRILQEGLGK